MLLQPYIPKPDPRYSWTSGVVRSLEKKLLRKTDYQKLIDLDEREVGQFVAEFGYNTRSYLDNDLDNQVAMLLSFVDKHSLDKELTDGYRMRWDYINASTLLRKKLLSKEHSADDILPWGIYGYEDFYKTLEGEKSDLPENIVKAIHDAFVDYEANNEIWRIGMVLDIAYLRYFVSKIPANTYLRQYYSMLCDELNLTTLLRYIEMEYKKSDYEEFFLDFGFIPLDFLNSVWEMDRASISSRFIHSFYGKDLQDAIAKAVSEDDMSFISNFFVLCRRNLLQESIYSAFGLEVLIAYFEKKRLEIDTLRTIFQIKSSNLDKSSIEKAVEYVIL